MSVGNINCCNPGVGIPASTQPAISSADEGNRAQVEGGGPTCFEPEPAPTPSACGPLVPTPSSSSEVNNETPPDPIELANEQSSEIRVASELSTWPQWQGHFSRLGLSSDEVARVGAAQLNDAQLAEVYEKLYTSVVDSGNTPGSVPMSQANTSGLSAWSTEWEKQFLALGLPAKFVATLKAEADKRGSDDAEISRVYAQVLDKIKAAGGVLPSSGDSQVGPAQDQTSTSSEQPGWNAQFEQAFRALGMPDEVIQMYAQSGAPASGLEAAYRHVTARLQDFTDRGWMEKFTAAGVDPVTTWSAILGDKPAKDKDLETLLKKHDQSKESIWQRGGEIATSIFPGGHLLKYVFGRDLTGDKVDRTSPMQIGMAALSGLAAFAAIRGGKSVLAGIAARNGEFSALKGVNDTLSSLGLSRGGVDGVEQAAMGATQTWGLKQKIAAFIPGTSLHREVVGLGHAEAAARAFNNGGAASMFANEADGALRLATITQMFDDLKSGAVAIQGGGNAYLGSLKKGPIMSLGALRDGREVINVSKGLRIGNGNSQLVGLMGIGGQKLGANPAWLGSASVLADDIAALAKTNQDTLGSVMAGNLARDLGSFSSDGRRALKYISGLSSGHTPSWYDALSGSARAQLAGSAASQEMLDLLSDHHLFTSVFDEVAVGLAKVDRSTLTPEVAGLMDDVASKMDDARSALDAAKLSGTMTDDAAQKIGAWNASVASLLDAEPSLAGSAFTTMVDDGAFSMAQVAARDAAKAEWASIVAARADDVADVTAGGTSAVLDDALQGARSLTGDELTGAASTPLSVNAAGEAVTPSGLIVPSYASPVGAATPTSIDDPSIARLAEMMRRVRI